MRKGTQRVEPPDCCARYGLSHYKGHVLRELHILVTVSTVLYERG